MIQSQSLQATNYSIEYFNDENKFSLYGKLKLNNIENYDEIMRFIYNNASNTGNSIILDLSGIRQINATGVTAICLLMIKMRDFKIPIEIIADKYAEWHKSTLHELEELNENVITSFVTVH